MMQPRPVRSAETHWLNRPLAIIGMACRLPGADGLDEYWQLLSEGRDAIGPLPDSILDRRRYYDPRKSVRGKSYTDLGGLVTPRPLDLEFARQIGPIEDWDECHLNFCEVAAQACRHAGLDPANLPLRKAGVFVGHSGGSPRAGELAYRQLAPRLLDLLDELDSWKSLPDPDTLKQRIVEQLQAGRPTRRNGKPWLDASFVAGLTSQALGLTGPHMAIDAACASSLIALTLGANSLHSGESDMVIVGGAAFNKSDSLILFSQAQSCSAKGSKPFDASADGLIGSEGYVALVVKTLERAVADGDKIQAIVRGIGMASDGRGKSLWAPRSEGQYTAIERAYGADLSPASVQLIEAHATSTQVGDATEVTALAEFFKQYVEPGRRIPVGSVKSNIGHTLETAGLASLVKVILSMQRQAIPPSVHVEQLNPAIRWDEVPLEIATQLQAWPPPADDMPRRAAVNAFGIGGLNVHVVVEEVTVSAQAALQASATPTYRTSAASASQPVEEPIAIVGRGVVLPGAISVAALKQLLAAPRSMLTASAYERLGEHAAGFINDFQYDWRKHKVPPKQIAQANPLQFMLLDAAEQAFGEAGLRAEDLDRQRTAVVVGNAFGGDFGNSLFAGLRLPELRDRIEETLAQAGVSAELADKIYSEYEARFLSLFPALLDETGSFTASTLASRLTKSLNLMGGAMAVDAGECSGLAALNVARRLLQGRTANYVLAAAAQRSLDLVATDYYDQCGGDSAAGLGEGVALVLVMRLDDARREGRTVLGLLPAVGIGTHHDAPLDRQSIADSVRVAADRLQAPTSTISVNSTGKPAAELFAGDQKSLARAVPSPLHAVTGYLQATQALADVICGTLGNSHAAECQVVSHALSGQSYVALLQSEAALAKSSSELRGDRVAKVDQQLSTPAQLRQSESDYQLYRFAADTRAALAAGLLELQPTNTSTSFSGAVFCHGGFPGAAAWRATVVARPNELLGRCRTLSEQIGNVAARLPLAEQGMFWAAPDDLLVNPTVAWLFPGQGSQRCGMLRELVETNAVAAEVVREADVVLARLQQPTFSQLAWEQDNRLGSDVWQTQAAMLIADTILYRVLVSSGLTPDIVCGHSFGEFAALLAAGCWDLETALIATWHRCRAIVEHVQVDAAMLSLQADRDSVDSWIVNSGSHVELSHINASDQIVVGGRRAAIDDFEAWCSGQQVNCRKLSVPTAFHTSILQPAVTPFRQELSRIQIRRPNTPIISSVTGDWHSATDAIRDALSEQLVTRLDFVSTVDRLKQAGVKLFVEVGPQQVLTRLVRPMNGSVGVVATDNANRGSAFQLLCAGAYLETVILAMAGKPSQSPATRSTESTKRVTSSIAIISHDATQRRRDRLRQTGERIARSDGANVEPVRTTPLTFDATSARRETRRQQAIVQPTPAPALPASIESVEVPAVQSVSALVQPAFVPTAETESQAVGNERQREQVVSQFLIDFVVEQTGYPAEIIDLDWDMEADLGIDSIKKAQLFGELREFFDLESQAGKIRLDDFRTLRQIVSLLLTLPGKADWLDKESASQEQPASAPDAVVSPAATLALSPVPVAPEPARVAPTLVNASNASVNVQPPALHGKLLEQFLIDFVVEHTGYPAEVVEIEADLEADLGIDSIKKAQLMGELRDTLGGDSLANNNNGSAASASEQMKSLAAVRTLGDILRLMAPTVVATAPDSGDRQTLSNAVVVPDALGDKAEENCVSWNDRHNASAAIDVAEDWQVSPSYQRSIERYLQAMAGRVVRSSQLDQARTQAQLHDLLNGHAERHRRQLARLADAVTVDSRNLEKLQQLVFADARWRKLKNQASDIDVMPACDQFAWLAELELPAWLTESGGELAVVQNPVNRRLAVPGVVEPLAVLATPELLLLGILDPQAPQLSSAEVLAYYAHTADLIEENPPQTLQESIALVREFPSRLGQWLIADARQLKAATIVRRRTEAGESILEIEQEFVQPTSNIANHNTIAIGIDCRTRQLVIRQRSGAVVPLAEQPIEPQCAPQLERPTIPQITQRYVLRMVPVALRNSLYRKPEWHGTALVIGDNPVARQLEGRLIHSGVHTIRWASTASADELAERFEQLRREKKVPHLFLTTPLDAAAVTTGSTSDWNERKYAGLMSNFWLCQQWNTHIREADLGDEASLVLVSSMGGDFGLSGHLHSVEGGGLAGLTKSMLIENWMQGQRTLRFKIIDTQPSDIPAEVVNRVWEELANPNYDIEVGHRRDGQRLALRALIQRLQASPSATNRSPALQPGSNWVFTGGARGITAFVAEHLAVRYGLQLHLLGMSPSPQIDASWHALTPQELLGLKARIMTEARSQGQNAVKAWQDTEKLIEIDATLQRLRGRGISVHYHQCDVADAAAVASTLSRVRELSGPIHGVVHGAGFGRDARFDRKQPDKVRQCIGAKVDGAFALMEATAGDPLHYFVGFGSISGRFGANGHADYSLANEMLCKQVDWLRRQRPQTKCIAFHWHAWGDVGMATKPETKLALEMIQMQFMPASEGLQHLIAELEGAGADTEILITDERYQRMYYPADAAQDSWSEAGKSGRTPLITDKPEARVDGSVAYRIQVNPKTDPFLSEHCLEGRPLMPMVMAAEMFLEAGSVEFRSRALQLSNLTAHSGLRFFSDQPREVIIGTQRTEANNLQCGLYCDFLSRDGRLVEAARQHFSATLTAIEQRGGEPLRLIVDAGTNDWRSVHYPNTDAPLWHGSALRKLRKVMFVDGGLIGRIAAPALIELAGPLRDVRGWMSPSAALDACLYAVGYLAWHQARPSASVPVSIGRFATHRLPLPGEACEVHVRLVQADERGAQCNFALYGVDGQLICQADDYRIAWLDASPAIASGRDRVNSA